MSDVNLLYEFELYIESVYGVIKESDEPSPTFEWDIAKEKIDKSKIYVDSAKEAFDYLSRLVEKVNNLPKSIREKLIKYVAFSFIGILSMNAMSDIIPADMPNVKRELARGYESQSAYGVSVDKTNQVKSKDSIKNNVVIKSPTKSSESLRSFLKYEEGSIKEKGEPVLAAYDIGDGMITVGWGHAEIESESELNKGDVISRDKAEILLSQDIKDAEDGLNRLLRRWDKKGIKYQINQDMYDAMVSMIFNMGIGNFLKSDFIQLVKSGNYDAAEQKILTTNVSYPGHIPRREQESKMFSGSHDAIQLSMKEVRRVIRGVLKEEFFAPIYY